MSIKQKMPQEIMLVMKSRQNTKSGEWALHGQIYKPIYVRYKNYYDALEEEESARTSTQGRLTRMAENPHCKLISREIPPTDNREYSIRDAPCTEKCLKAGHPRCKCIFWEEENE